MFHNVLMTSLTTPLASTNELTGWENRPFRTIWPEKLDESIKSPEITKTIKKKPKRNRRAYTTEQLWALEKTYLQSKYVDRETRKTLSKRLNIPEKALKIWFQNRRMKEKRSSESESENFSSSPLMSPSDVDSVATENVKSVQPTASGVTDLLFPTNTQISSYNNVPYSMPEATQYVNHSWPQNFHSVDYYYPVNFGRPAESQTSAGDTNQYQFPDYQFNRHFVDCSSPVARAFFHDTNVYPTEYYPNGYENFSSAALPADQSGAWLDSFDQSYV